MKYIIGILVWFLSFNFFNFQTKHSIFKITKYQPYFNLKLSNKFYKKVYQSLNQCLLTCSFEEVCNLVEFNKSEQSCIFFTDIDEGSIQTTVDDNYNVYRKQGYLFFKGFYRVLRSIASSNFLRCFGVVFISGH